MSFSPSTSHRTARCLLRSRTSSSSMLPPPREGIVWAGPAPAQARQLTSASSWCTVCSARPRAASTPTRSTSPTRSRLSSPLAPCSPRRRGSERERSDERAIADRSGLKIELLKSIIVWPAHGVCSLHLHFSFDESARAMADASPRVCGVPRAPSELREERVPGDTRTTSGWLCTFLFRTRMFIFTKRFSVTHTRSHDHHQLGFITPTDDRVNGVS